ncbi:hypothetical protein H0W91_01460, partial [Patescibacteria group bacterium]|nr:hypothetical protein [Patescibacteria group bacterium]
SIYEALGVLPPIFATTPPVMGEEGNKKLGKRDGAKDVMEFEKEGYLPETMMNFLALLGWNPGGEKEIFTKDELINLFTLEKIQKSGGQFGEDKLDWMNKEHLKLMDESVRNEQIHNKLLENPLTSKSEIINNEKLLSKIYPIIFDHISKWGDIDTLLGVGEWSYFFNSPEFEASLLSWKGKTSVLDITKHLNWLLQNLTNASEEIFEDSEKIKSLIFDYATENGRGEVLWPMRVALSGKEKSPDPFTLAYVLGKNKSIKRIKSAISKLS